MTMQFTLLRSVRRDVRRLEGKVREAIMISKHKSGSLSVQIHAYLKANTLSNVILYLVSLKADSIQKKLIIVTEEDIKRYNIF